MRVLKVGIHFSCRKGKMYCNRAVKVDIPIDTMKLSDGTVIKQEWISSEWLAFVARPVRDRAPNDADRWLAIAGPKGRKKK